MHTINTYYFNGAPHPHSEQNTEVYRMLTGDDYYAPSPYQDCPLLRFADSTFPGNPPRAREFQPLKTKILPESNPPKSGLSARRIGRVTTCPSASQPACTCIYVYVYIYIYIYIYMYT